MERPCQCGECHLCAVYAAANGLPVRKAKQPTLADLKAFNDEATEKGKKSTKRKAQRPDDDAGLFTGVE